MELGSRLKRYRIQAGYSQREAAEMMGIKFYLLCNYETGRSEPNIATLKAMSQLYQASIDDLVDNQSQKDVGNRRMDNKYDDLKNLLDNFVEEVNKINQR